MNKLYWTCNKCHAGFILEPNSTQVPDIYLPYCPYCGQKSFVRVKAKEQIPMLEDAPTGRYQVRHGHTRRYKPTRAEEDIIVAEYEDGVRPSLIQTRWNISPGLLYRILPKHHIDLIHKPKQKRLKIKSASWTMATKNGRDLRLRKKHTLRKEFKEVDGASIQTNAL